MVIAIAVVVVVRIWVMNLTVAKKEEVSGTNEKQERSRVV